MLLGDKQLDWVWESTPSPQVMRTVIDSLTDLIYIPDIWWK